MGRVHDRSADHDPGAVEERIITGWVVGRETARENAAVARRRRRTAVGGALVMVTSIAVALVVPSPVPACFFSYSNAPTQPGALCPQSYGLIPLRVGIVILGLIIAVIMVWDGRSPRHPRW